MCISSVLMCFPSFCLVLMYNGCDKLQEIAIIDYINLFAFSVHGSLLSLISNVSSVYSVVSCTFLHLNDFGIKLFNIAI